MPVPLRVTVSGYCVAGVTENTASTLVAAFMVTVQVDMPKHAPLQPEKIDPELGVAVSVTLVP